MTFNIIDELEIGIAIFEHEFKQNDAVYSYFSKRIKDDKESVDIEIYKDIYTIIARDLLRIKVEHGNYIQRIVLSFSDLDSHKKDKVRLDNITNKGTDTHLILVSKLKEIETNIDQLQEKIGGKG